MVDLETRFAENFTKNSVKFGRDYKDLELDFLFFVEIPLNLETQEKMRAFLDYFRAKLPKISPWILPDDMGITLALPGRMGTHFQGNHVGFMEEKIKNIAEKISAFSMEMGELNCFEKSLFREIYDKTGNLQKLHDAISEGIPFAQNPEFQYENFLPRISILHLGEKIGEFFGENFDRSYARETFTATSINFGKVSFHEGKLEKIVLKRFDLA